MDESSPSPQPVCAQEMVDLLNCVTASPFDQDKCLCLLHSLRDCVQVKKVKKFTLKEQNEGKVDSKSKKND
ncbi:hypothetical protein RHGRI_005975 [Rhododendron griersonianum]|uniref:Cysteine alpha-hairpin motif superfamily n=1 Tax=Rhododendron griersonianum TaxID=479676 RepID=A0AAV6LFA0_9ERIC|nr:hypothetical protein RHGRI_005975 [Rhododendron griersonianum]